MVPRLQGSWSQARAHAPSLLSGVRTDICAVTTEKQLAVPWSSDGVIGSGPGWDIRSECAVLRSTSLLSRARREHGAGPAAKRSRAQALELAARFAQLDGQRPHWAPVGKQRAVRERCAVSACPHAVARLSCQLPPTSCAHCSSFLSSRPGQGISP